MNIISVNLDLIKPYWRNPRKNEAAVSAVMESIKKYGMNVPIVVDKNYVILTGHTRYKAMRALGVTEAPVVVADISEKKAKQFRIADNKAHEFSEWDVDTLKSEIQDLMGEGTTTGLEEVFGSADWREMLDITSLLPDADNGEDDSHDVQKDDDDIQRNMIDGRWGLNVICPHCLENNLLRQEDFDQEEKSEEKE